MYPLRFGMFTSKSIGGGGGVQARTQHALVHGMVTNHYLTTATTIYPTYMCLRFVGWSGIGSTCSSGPCSGVCCCGGGTLLYELMVGVGP